MLTYKIISGGFDPIHEGHLKMVDDCYRTECDGVIAIVMSDNWLREKKQTPFMSEYTRCEIMRHIKGIKEVYLDDIDSDGSVKLMLENIKSKHKDCKLIFVNGGDRTKDNIPEMTVQGLGFEFSVGGDDKSNSSSSILCDYISRLKSEYHENRQWGYFDILYKSDTKKIKRLVIKPDCSISLQSHSQRTELWFIETGAGIFTLNDTETVIKKNEVCKINKNEKHRIKNIRSSDLVILEIQDGNCLESDITRY